MTSPLLRAALSAFLIPFLIKGPQLLGFNEFLVALALSMLGAGIGHLVSLLVYPSEVCQSLEQRERAARLATISGLVLFIAFLSNLIYFGIVKSGSFLDPYFFYVWVFCVSLLATFFDRKLQLLGAYSKFLSRMRSKGKK